MFYANLSRTTNNTKSPFLQRRILRRSRDDQEGSSTKVQQEGFMEDLTMVCLRYFTQEGDHAQQRYSLQRHNSRAFEHLTFPYFLHIPEFHT